MSERYFKGERGVYLPLFLIMFSSLALILGLAIDGARLFLHQVRLQRAVDAALVSTMDELNNRPTKFLEDSAKLITSRNMDVSGFSFDTDDRTITARVAADTLPDGSVTPRTMHIDGRAKIPLYVIPWVPLMPKTAWVSAHAEATMGKLAVVLALDRSGSMSIKPPGSSMSRIEALRAAARNFTELLDDGDYLGIVSYTDGAYEDWPLQKFDRRQLPKLAALINALQPKWQTCMACGIKMARENFQANREALAALPKYLILMTDGIPDQDDSDQAEVDRGVKDGTSCGYTSNLESSDQGRRDIYQTIAQSDLARAYENLTVMTIGLGEDNYNPCCLVDTKDPNNPADTTRDRCLGDPANPTLNPDERFQKPWQPLGCYGWVRGAQDSRYVRPYVLLRLANDKSLELPYQGPPDESAPPAAPPFLPLGSAPDPKCNEDLNAGHCACLPRIGSNYPRGTYINTSNPDDLTEAFVKAFDYIKRPHLSE